MATEIVLLRPWAHPSWRPIEAVALRRAGGANTPIRPALDHLAAAWSHLPPAALDALLAKACEHIDGRVAEYRAGAGLSTAVPEPSPGRVVALRRADP